MNSNQNSASNHTTQTTIRKRFTDMKAKHVLILLSGLLALQSQLSAQEQGPAPLVLTAQLQPNKSNKLRRIPIMAPPGAPKGVFLYQVSREEPPVSDQVKNYKLFFIETPPDLAGAMRAYSSDDLNTAKRQLARVRATYAPFIGLPNNPSTTAALLELSCNARSMDWSELGKVVEEFPAPKSLEASNRLKLEAARVLSHVSDDPGTAESRAKEAEDVISSAQRSNSVTSETYTWLKYALARALASNIPPAELQKGISERNAKVASQAVDAYCEAAASAHGRYMEIPVDAMHRAFHILWAMPGVRDYIPQARKMDKKVWGAAPYNFKDAVALAYLLRNVYAPALKDEAVTTACGFYFSEQLNTKKAPKK